VSHAAPARPTQAPALDGLHDDFERAARAAGGTTDVSLTIAARPVCLRFACPAAAAALGRAFAHLAAAHHAAPSLTLHVWDSATAGADRPAFAPPRGADAEAAPQGTGASYFHSGGAYRALHQPASDALSVLSAKGDAGWFWTADATDLPYWDYTAPFRHLLSWWLDARGCHHVHGGAVGTTEGGVLLAGSGGSGKSTAALASLLDERLRYAGDDYVAVSTEGQPFVHSLYCSGKVHREDVHRLPHLRPALHATRADEKAVFYVAALPGRSIAGFPLRAIVLPRVTDRPTARVRRSTQAAALAALAPSTIFQLHPPAREALSHLADVARTVPAFFLELGADVATIPAELVRLLEQVG
jgi:hypothetical protein